MFSPRNILGGALRQEPLPDLLHLCMGQILSPKHNLTLLVTDRACRSLLHNLGGRVRLVSLTYIPMKRRYRRRTMVAAMSRGLGMVVVGISVATILT